MRKLTTIFLIGLACLAACSVQKESTAAIVENNSVTKNESTAIENILPANFLEIVSQETVKLKLGDAEVQVIISKGKTEKPLFFNMHDDENTSVEAAKAFVAKYDGKVIELAHDGSRLIKFKLKNEQFTIDPNRIFTAVGITETLKKNGKTSPEAEKEIDAFAKNLIAKFLADSTIIVAMHNNSENAYSVKSYEKGGDSEKDAAQVFTKPENDVDAFFFVTEQKHFDAFKTKGFNVVLQNNQTVTDDGSLSVYCGKGKITYINVEAQHGHAAQQLKMLEALREVLGN